MRQRAIIYTALIISSALYLSARIDEYREERAYHSFEAEFKATEDSINKYELQWLRDHSLRQP